MAQIVGQRSTPADSDALARLPAIRNRYRFLYLAHPFRWEFCVEEHELGRSGWLPDLGRLNLTAGAGGVTDGNVIDLALVQVMQRKWQVIREDDPRLGEFAQYCVKFPSRGRSAVWGSMFESVKLLGGRALWSHDDELYRDFRRHLLDSGIVDAPDQGVIDVLIEDRQTRLIGMEGQLAVNPTNSTLAARIGARRLVLDKMQSERTAAPGAGVDDAISVKTERPAPLVTGARTASRKKQRR